MGIEFSTGYQLLLLLSELPYFIHITKYFVKDVILKIDVENTSDIFYWIEIK